MTVSRSGTTRLSVWHFKRVLALIVSCLLVNGAVFATIYRHWKIREILATLEPDEQDFFIIHEKEINISREMRSSAWGLIEKTRVAIKAAGGVPGVLLSAPEKKAWDAAHPCAGRHHLLRLWSREKMSTPVQDDAYTTEPSILLHALFEEYANLHRTCTHGGDMEHVTKLYASRNDSSPCKFLVVEFGTYGVGNRLLWLVSAYQYALLTTRVLLIDTRSTVHALLCEPFPGSSWNLPDTFPYSSEQRWPLPSQFQKMWDAWESDGVIDGRSVRKKPVAEKNRWQEGLKNLDPQDIERERRETMASMLSKIQAEMDRTRSKHIGRAGTRNVNGIGWRTTEERRSRKVPYFHRVQANDGWSPNPRFFCDNEQERLRLVKWISFSSGCLYFLPDLFAVPSFKPALEELFPDRDPLTHLLRQLMLPVDSIWTKVHNLYRNHFKSASRVVGIQVRYREGPLMYRTLNNVVNTRISSCAQAHGIIPVPSASSNTTRRSQTNHDGPVVLFVASLYRGARSHLESIYAEAIKRRGKPALKVVQLSNLGFQSFNPDSDHQAFVEIVCLSLADELLTSPLSTYGQMAQAYGALTPWLINFDPQASSDCVRGQSTDACYQTPIAKLTCPFNKDVDGMAMADVATYLKPCQDISDGLQLVPPWTPSLLH